MKQVERMGLGRWLLCMYIACALVGNQVVGCNPRKGPALESRSAGRGSPESSVLVYGPTDHAEEQLLTTLGYTVEVWDAKKWAGATNGDFSPFDLLVVDAQSCNGPDRNGELEVLTETQETWGPAMDGRVLVSGLDLACHIVDWQLQRNADVTAPPTLHDNAMVWLTEGAGTGGYFATDWGRRKAAHLQVLGPWVEVERRGSTVHILEPEHPLFRGIAAKGLNNWRATYHTYFTTWPEDFQVLAKGAEGYPVILVRESKPR